MGQGKGVRPVVTAVAGLRPALCAPPLAALVSSSVQECSEEWVIKFVASAPDAQEQSFFAQAAEIFSFVLFAHLSWADLIVSGLCYISEQLDFYFRYVCEIGPKLLVLQALENRGPEQFWLVERAAGEGQQLSADKSQEIGMAEGCVVKPF